MGMGYLEKPENLSFLAQILFELSWKIIGVGVTLYICDIFNKIKLIFEQK